MPHRRIILALAGALTLPFAADAMADPPWKRGRHHHHGYGSYGPGWGPPPVVIVPAPAWRPPPVVVVPGYAVPYTYGYGPGWGYAPYGGEAEFRLRLPFR